MNTYLKLKSYCGPSVSSGDWFNDHHHSVDNEIHGAKTMTHLGTVLCWVL